eukprot:715189-Alexandrium_andersonii.AAC.1
MCIRDSHGALRGSQAGAKQARARATAPFLGRKQVPRRPGLGPRRRSWLASRCEAGQGSGHGALRGSQA